MKHKTILIVLVLLFALVLCGSASADTVTSNDTTNYTVNDTNYTISVMGTNSGDSGSDCLPTIAHDKIQGEVYISSTAGWPSSNPDNFNVPNGTVVFARYYTGVWMPDTVSTTFNGNEVSADATYATDMGATWIAYDVTDYIITGGLNTATSYSSGGDGRQYGNTLVVLLQNDDDPYIEYWITEGLDWLVGSNAWSYTTLEGTVNQSAVENASLYSVILTGYGSENLNGNTLPSATEHVSGGYFDAIRWDNIQDLLVTENQSVNVLGDGDYTSLVFHALTITYNKSDLEPVDLTPTVVVPETSNTLIATITNNGNVDASTFNVSLLVDGTVVDTQSVASLAGGSSTTVNFQWTPTGTEDSYTLTVSVDPEDAIDEGVENNNSLDVLVGTSTSPPPVADFIADTTSGTEPLTVTFTDQSSNGPTEWLWDFGDGTTSTDQNPTHPYTIPGTYNVTLTATNAGGSGTKEKKNYIIVKAVTPVANFSVDTTSAGASSAVQFTDTSTHFPTGWVWDFGDGTTSTEQNPTHTYISPGTYTVKLAVTNAAGLDTEVKTNYITVYIVPVANFTASTTSGNAVLPVVFTDASSNSPTEWLWDFGDGTTSTSRNPTHTYNIPGTYAVALTVINVAGTSTTTLNYITVPEITGPLWTVESEWNTADIGSRANPVLADLDGDGDYDLLIGENSGVCYGYENTGTDVNPVWTAKSEWNTADVGSYAAPVLADLDGDGDYDLLIGANNGICYGYENTGNSNSPIWTAKSEWNTADVGSYSNPALADLDGDGDYDLLIGESSGVCYGYENTGSASSPVWTAKSAWNTADVGSRVNPVLADLDGDGDYDLLIGEYSGVCYGYENTAPQPGEAPDLTPISVEVPTLYVDTPCTITATVSNEGTVDVGAFVATLSVDGVVVDTQNVSGPAAGSTSTVNFTWTPTTLEDHTFAVTVDSVEGIVELDETNNVLAAPPVTEFSADVTSGDPGLTVNFTDESSNAPTEWLWDFGDGTTSNEQNPTHPYTIPGTYTVTLTTTNVGGSSTKEKTNYITVHMLVPVADFTANNTSIAAPYTVQFTDQSTYDSTHMPTSWFWDFGDGTTSTEQNPTHTYTTAGKCTVKLLVSNEFGFDTAEKTDYITVYIPPVADFTTSTTSGKIPVTVSFSDESSNSPKEWLWDFGDGTTSTDQNPTHTYTTPGTYTVTLTVTNVAGSDTATKIGYLTILIETNPVWAEKTEWNTINNGNKADPALADLDGDGDYDLLIGTYNGICYAYENTGTNANPVWTAKSEWNTVDVGTYANPVLADLDGDGDYDLLIGELNGVCYGYENTGTTTNPIWTAKSEWDTADIGRWASPTLADLDGDGDYDLLIGAENGVCYCYENTGTTSSPVWTAKSEWNTPGLGSYTYPSPYLNDLDGDGDYDLLLGQGYGIIYGYENTGTRSSPVWTRKSEWDIAYIAQHQDTALADLDGDGDYDLLIGATDGVCYGYENTAPHLDLDLTPTSVDVPSSIKAGTPYTITATVSNNGTIDVGAFVATLSVDGVVVDTQNVIGPAAGSTSTVNFNWTPDTTGDHTLMVTVDSVDGISESDETNNNMTVTANVKMALPVADFVADDISVTTVDSVQFTDQSTNSPTEWLWDFGDGTTSNLQNPTHTYTTPGTYTVKLTATNDGGSAVEEKTDYITVVLPSDLAVTGVNCQQSTVFAGETNNVTITVVNNGVNTATNIVVNLYASDVDGGSTVVATTTIDSLEAGASTTVTLVDPTIRPITADTAYESSNVSHVTYMAQVDPGDTIPESNESNNLVASDLLPVYYNGYKGKRYGYNGEDATSSDTNTAGDISTKHAYDIVGDVIYSSGTSVYHGVGWTSSISTWTTSDLSVPSTATVLDALLYVAYNWDTTSDGNPDWTITFNGVNITPIALYTDQKNFGGSWALYKYGLLVYNVTSLYKVTGENTLNITALAGNSNALYPSTLITVYSDPNSTRKQIFINEECDELLYGADYGLTLDEVTAYAPFTGLTIDTSNVITATLHSFAGSAGANEGNLIWNDTLLAGNAWQGDSYSASALIFDVTNYLNSMGNVVGVQGTSTGGMVALQQILVVEYTPDLAVTNLTVNTGNGDNWFANEPNIISVTVTNQGGSASVASTVTVDINGTTYTLDVPALEVGASATVTITDNTNRTHGDTVPVTANTDPSNNIPETDETNNLMTTTFTVCNNGYKGKQYTDDDEYDSQETQQTFTGTYDVIYSSGNSAYIGSGWTEQTYTWTASDLSIPEGATVVSARLYQMYSYNKMGVDPAWTLSFNGNTLSTLATYSDIKGWGSYSYPYGLYVYDVTSIFNTAGNSMTITPEVDNKYSLYGAYLIVVYQDSNTTNKTIWINDGFDMLCSKASYSVNDTEATSYANYGNVDTSKVTNAQVIAILAGADKEDQSKFFFNGHEYTGFWDDYKGETGEPQTGFSVYDVTSTLQSGTNTAAMQSYDSGSGGDNMYTLTSILVTTLDTTPPEVNADVDSGTYNSVQSVTLTAADDQDTSPKIYYTTDGTTPTTSSTLYTGSITVDRAMTLSFVAVDDKGNLSPLQTKTYNIQSDVYVDVTPSNTAPVVGDTVTYTFKLGNRGPGVATDVVFTYQIPEGMEYVGVTIDKGENSDEGEVNYDPATRTITWTFDELDVCDPWLWLDLRVSSSGTYLVQPTLVTGNYNPSLTSNIGFAEINAIVKSVSTPQAATTTTTTAAATVASAATTTVQSGTVPMQTTGIPLAGLVLAILCVGSGLVINRKK